MLPEGWDVIKIGDAIKLSSGDTKPTDLQIEKTELQPYPVYGGNNIMGYSSQKNSVKPIVLIGRVGEYCGITRYIDEPCWITDNALFTKEIDSSIRTEYLSLSLKYYDLSRLRNKGGQPLISQKPIYGLKIPFPPLSEQKKIAQILSTWDNAISATERLLDNSQQRKKALMQQLLTGKKRLPGFEGEWESGTLGEIANIDSGYAFKSSDFTDSEEGIPIVKMSDFKEGRLDLSQAAKVSTKHLNNIDKFKLQVDDFVFGMSGSLSNYAWVKMENLPCYLNQRVGRIVSKKNSNHLFVTYLYLSDKVQQSILDKAAGAAQLNISVTDLRKLPIKYPSKIEQEKISSILMVSDQEIDAQQKRLDHLKLEKKALMQQLLTGKRRVLVDTAA